MDQEVAASSRRRRVIPIGLCILVIIATTAAALAGGSARRTGASSTQNNSDHFAGYVLYVHPTQISARWRVPREHPPFGRSLVSSWVGAQGPGQRTFVQVGTSSEDRLVTVTGLGTLHREDYEAWWSDAQVKFLPQPLGQVDGGDVVSAMMTRNDAGWTVRIIDRTAEIDRSQFVPFGRARDFNMAEWLVEEPSFASGRIADPFSCNLVGLDFSHLRVNGRVPPEHLMTPQVLRAPSGQLFGPGAIRDNAFSIGPVTNEVCDRAG